MKTIEISIPEIVGRKEWLTNKKALLEKEKELTRARDHFYHQKAPAEK